MARPYRARRWRQLLPDPAACLLIARSLNLSAITAQVLFNRGLTTPEAAHAFLTAGREQILDPFLLKDMDRAVALIRARIAAGRPIMVYGDYDVDGVTGTTILVLALRAMGAAVEYYIPNRFDEGYGLNVGALKEIRERGHDFVLSVDTGVSAVAEAVAARELGITLVISDHHEPGPVLPDVPALINPKRADCSYPFKGLSGVGVAFKLALALEAPGAWDLIDIVTLGTIADMVPLVGENRAIVREGMAALGNTRRPGLRALMQVAGIKEKVTATHVGFALGPRINALGRMGSAMQGVELLVTNDLERAAELARHLDEENRSRQEVEATILQEALQQAESLPAAEREYVIVLGGEGWHHGVVGICASRVLEAYHRPTVLLSLDEKEARGSARSIPAFHLHRALLQMSDLFTKFGGHAAAAGMTLRHREDLPVLRERLNRLAAGLLQPEDLVPELKIDAYIGADEVTDTLLAELSALEPHGIGNPQPLFGIRDLAVFDSRIIGKEQNHLKLLVRGAGPGSTMDAVGWNLAPAQPPAKASVQVACYPEYDTYQGRKKLRLTMRDLQVITASADGGFPVNLAAVPVVREEACLAWDPLKDLPEAGPPLPRTVVDARDERCAILLAQWRAPLPEVAVTAEPDETTAEAAEERPEPTRLHYLETLSASAGTATLILTASPWAAATLTAELHKAMPHSRPDIRLWFPDEPEPDGGATIVAAYGAAPTRLYDEVVLYHPPYRAGLVPPGRLHLLWQESDWDLIATTLSWPYPDRESLVELYKLLSKGDTGPTQLARRLGEMPGPWNRLRYEAGIRIFRELGLLSQTGSLAASNRGAKFRLETSAHFARGTMAQTLLADLRAGDWPTAVQGL